MARFLLLLTFLALAPVTLAQEASERDDGVNEVWGCFDLSDFSKENMVITLAWAQAEGAPKGQGYGLVEVAGQSIDAIFGMHGFNRRWNFGNIRPEDGAADYAFIISPGGEGMYYDFTLSADGTATPSQRYKCEQI